MPQTAHLKERCDYFKPMKQQNDKKLAMIGCFYVIDITLNTSGESNRAFSIFFFFERVLHTYSLPPVKINT